jgi:hypothetical protein
VWFDFNYCHRVRLFQAQEKPSAFRRRVQRSFTVVAMCVSDENRSPFAIHGCGTAPSPTGFAEIVRDYSQYFINAESNPQRI